ncbi:lipase 3-like [Musca autumnalis]|uniref:lipase 3-like n=1 Tax=Musca autumnalis TaxID=221902 RepID=UPI003CFA59B1
MKIRITSIALLVVVIFTSTNGQLNLNTCDRITRHGYPCEKHTVTTSDGYILSLFRIPASSRKNEVSPKPNKPAVLLMHCLLCSSDIFVLAGPNDGLPFMLADDDYDVWIGNARGNVYSQRHTSLSPLSEAFWSFSMDEIGLIDIPAKIEYILAATNQTQLHYIGYSQGTLVLAILLSAKPRYSEKLKAVHLLAPAIFMCHVRSPPILLFAHFLGKPSPAANIIGTFPSQEIFGFLRLFANGVCKNALFTELCIKILNLFSGWDSPYLNRTLLPEMLLTTPAGGSNLQINQYLQLATSCEFKAYDYGPEGNIRKYGKPKPPVYNVTNIQTREPIEFYYAENDFLAAWEDVKDLYGVLGDRAKWNRVRYRKYNHFDFTLSTNVKSCINNCILDRLDKYEGRPFKGDLCKCFRKEPFPSK